MQEINHYLEQLRQGDREGAFFGLLEMGQEALPTLMAMYHIQKDGGTRAFLVEVVWQNRNLSTIPFLGKVLNDDEPMVWKMAIDGLVSLATHTALSALQSARVRKSQKSQMTEEYHRWIDEAIEQIETKLITDN
jgi:hypothetical protein